MLTANFTLLNGGLSAPAGATYFCGATGCKGLTAAQTALFLRLQNLSNKILKDPEGGLNPDGIIGAWTAKAIRLISPLAVGVPGAAALALMGDATKESVAKNATAIVAQLNTVLAHYTKPIDVGFTQIPRGGADEDPLAAIASSSKAAADAVSAGKAAAAVGASITAAAKGAAAGAGASATNADAIARAVQEALALKAAQDAANATPHIKYAAIAGAGVLGLGLLSVVLRRKPSASPAQAIAGLFGYRRRR